MAPGCGTRKWHNKDVAQGCGTAMMWHNEDVARQGCGTRMLHNKCVAQSQTLSKDIIYRCS